MMESIAEIRQMMAEAKYIEAQQEVEKQLSLQDASARKDLIPLLLEILEQQSKALPLPLVIECVESFINTNVELASYWIKKSTPELNVHDRRRVQLIRIQIAEKKGRLKELYELISDYQLFLFESNVPVKNQLINSLVDRYFRNDFRLKLQELALILLLNDLAAAESIIKDLLFSCIEKASPKGTREKLIAIREVLKNHPEKKQLEVYQSYCSVVVDGIQSKQDYKRVIEMIIYFDDFKLQILVLDLLFKNKVLEVIEDYARVIRSSPTYNFVYLEKYFSHLKGYFIKPANKVIPASKVTEQLTPEDLELTEPVSKEGSGHNRQREILEEEQLLIQTLKYQDYSASELIDLAVSFLQSELVRAAASAAELAMTRAGDDGHQFLKACYLKLTCLCYLGDFRAALDLSYLAVEKAKDKNDILSFLYLQAESLQHLGQMEAAKKILRRILEIDPGYRLTRERLARLDEI